MADNNSIGWPEMPTFSDEIINNINSDALDDFLDRFEEGDDLFGDVSMGGGGGGGAQPMGNPFARFLNGSQPAAAAPTAVAPAAPEEPSSPLKPMGAGRPKRGAAAAASASSSATAAAPAPTSAGKRATRGKAVRAHVSDDEDEDTDDDDDDGDFEDSHRHGSTSGGGGSKAARGTGAGGGDDEPPDEALKSARERNRLHARKSRLRKKLVVDKLQEQLNRLAAENQRMRAFLETRSGAASAAPSSGAAAATAAVVPALPLRALASGLASAAASSSSTSVGSSSPGAAGRDRDPQRVLSRDDYGVVASLMRGYANFVVVDPNLPDLPIVFASSGFYLLTGECYHQPLCLFLITATQLNVAQATTLRR
jgi:hypothetical protein